MCLFSFAVSSSKFELLLAPVAAAAFAVAAAAAVAAAVAAAAAAAAVCMRHASFMLQFMRDKVAA